jgi:arylsulfatase A-like enzyme
MSRNVLLLVCDTARADAFEPYGAAAGSTPTTAHVAASGRAVPDVFSTACWTLPSHASMFTGIMPRELGLGQAPGGAPQGARPVLERHRDRLLPEVLRRAGWDTRAASTNVWVSPHAGFDIGFDRFELVHAGSRQEHVNREGPSGRAVWAYEGLRARADDGAGEVEAILRRWLAESPQRPFFWFVNLVECHSPYLPPRPYNDLGPIDRMKAADEARRHLSLEAIWRTCLGAKQVPGDALERMRHLYARSVRLMDDWLARVLEALDDDGVLDDTLVIVTSDHGENFGENGLLAHAFSIDDRLTRVPFVVNQPDFETGEGARSLVELPRLLARHLELDEHPWAGPDLPDGIAAAQFEFIEADDARLQIATDEWNLDHAGQAMITTPLTCAIDGDLKLMLRGDSEELYDLTGDPLEERPMAPRDHSDQPRVARLREALGMPSVRRSSAASAMAAAPVQRDEVDDLESRMKLLGYM